jgi:uncharacterized surface protein with fasciclin (FAS1) repeats
MNIKNNIRVALLALAALTATGSMVSCSDDPDAENYYTFTGEMLSDYLNNRPQYSEFKTIVERADLMDLLASYGQYTCFLPSNEAVETFLHEKGLQSVDQLSDADCDTIARTHLVANMYSTYEMTQDRLATANMLGRYLATSQGVDADSNAVVYIEGVAHIIYEKEMPDGSIIHRNDSVENGIVQPIDMVIEKSNSYIADILRDNPRISYFYEALIATDVKEQILLVDDPTYDKFNYNNNVPYRYKSHIRNEVAWVPDTKKYGFTAFVEPDSVYEAKFQEYGISTANGTLRALYDLACKIYDPVYPDDVNKDGHKFENLKDSINPLKRFVQYHIMTRYVPGTADLTALIIPEMKEAFGTETKWQNAIDWYQTLLPHTMLKVEQLSTHPREDPHTNKVIPGMDIYGPDADKKNGHFINRRYEAPEWTFRGAYVDPTVETKPVHDALNGHYFYVDDLVVFSWDVQNRVQNMRIRMDFTTLFPEVMTNDMRLKGNYRADDGNNAPADDSAEPKNGKNHYFPMGYLDGVTFDDKLCALVYRRPHWEFWSWQGDEWNLFGDYDFVFRIPPVPFSGEWQMRLGFAPLETRGVMQVYFGTDPKNLQPQGIPLDMMQILNSETYLGSRVSDDLNLSEYRRTSVEELAEEQKLLKNLGAYRGPLACYYTAGTDKSYDYGTMHIMRRILCQTNMDANQDYYIRFRVASEAKQGNNNEFMFDFFEMVPKSVYGVDGEGEMEDAL